MAKLVGVERIACEAVDLGLRAGEVVFEQPEVALLQRQLGADGLEAGPAIGDGVDQSGHLRARLVDAGEQLGLFSAERAGPVVVIGVGVGDGRIEQFALGAELRDLLLGPLLDLVGVDLLDRALAPSVLER